MSMNKFMHPRNIYKIPPNFKELAINYPEFRKHTKQELSGKVSIDFKDPDALRALTSTLLLRDFNLTVEIPLDKLIPTLPLRLNYVLWIEDLLQVSGLSNNSKIYGIDIGTGASCIYPLLSAKTKGWHMLSTEIDENSAEFAARNVKANNLEHLIKVKKVDTGTILQGIIEEGKTYTFSMCNPPFFGNEKEIIASGNRSMNRTPPSNSFTGTWGELVVEGGEVAFIRNMIKESVFLGKTVSLYTTMVGHKSNVMQLKKEITAAGANSVGSYELCQGRTTRWVLAWTFDDKVKTTVDFLVSKKSKAKPPLRYILPRKEGDSEYTLNAFEDPVKEIIHHLEMESREISRSNKMMAYEITAYKNTWSKQRMKRRAAQGKIREDVIEIRDENNKKEYFDRCEVQGRETSLLASNECPLKRPRMEAGSSSHLAREENKFSECSVSLHDGRKGKAVPLLKASLVMRSVGTEIYLELAWKEGLNGRDAVHQVLQFIKNNLKK